MNRNLGPTSEPYKYTAATEGMQLLATRKERSGLLKGPVFYFSFICFVFILDWFVLSFKFGSEH